MGNHGVALSADIHSCTTGSLTLDAGTVLACRWQLLHFDETTGTVSLDYQISETNLGGPILMAKCEPAEKSEKKENIFSKCDAKLSELYSAGKDEVKLLKDAVCIVMKSSCDIQSLLDMCADKCGEEKPFLRQLENSATVLTLLELIGCSIEDGHINLKMAGPFCTLIPVLIESLSVFESEDLEFITKCVDYQREELLRIIKATFDDQTSIPIDSNFKKELQKEQVENVLAVMDFEVDIFKGEVSPPSKKTCVLEAMFYLLNCL